MSRRRSLVLALGAVLFAVLAGPGRAALEEAPVALSDPEGRGSRSTS